MARYIDADKLVNQFKCNGGYFTYGKKMVDAIVSRINKQPTADVVEVVRCWECKYYNLWDMACIYPHHNGLNGVNGYCNYGERRDT